MLSVISKVVSALFVLLIYCFIFMVVRLIYSDIRVMSRKKAGLPEYEAYLKPIRQKNDTGLMLKDDYPLCGDDVIGRGRDCSISIDDNFMSKKNTRIFSDKADYYVEDLDSENGTLLNGAALTDEAVELLSGDRLLIGKVEFVFLRPEVKNGEISL